MSTPTRRVAAPTPLILTGFAVAWFAAPSPARAQQAADPATAVDRALGNTRPETRRVVRHNGPAHDWTVPLRTRRGVCYEIIAQAAGSSRVDVVVLARRARIAEPLPIATANVARTRFCASLPGNVYSALVHSEGATTWALALRAAPANEADTAASSVPAGSSAPRSVSSPPPSTASAAPAQTFPIGGTENDFPGQQLRAAVQGRNPRAVIAAQRVDLATNQSHTSDLPLIASHCILAVAAGVPSASDLALQIDDPAGNRVAEDTTHRGVESISYCPPYSGTYHFHVRMFAGHGLTGIQAFEVRP